MNADAMQLYRGMDIGTAKLPAELRQRVPHHLLDVLDVTDEATVSRYQTEARAVVGAILDRGNWPILVGGSGLYVSSVIFDFQFPGSDPMIRARLEDELAQQGSGALYRRLRDVDPDAAARIGAQNARRIVRALEVAEITGEPVSGSLPDEPVYWTPATIIGLRAPRNELTTRLDRRVLQMWRDGLVDEVSRLRDRGLESGVTARRAIGYAQALGELTGELTRAQAIELTQQLTRRYARRQMSWFTRYRDALWFDYDSDMLLQQVLQSIL
ncbi:tRNA (adenosine(37)-N6)-dimethylallyltransferase MiaA [Okibacterium endophyticum]